LHKRVRTLQEEFHAKKSGEESKSLWDWWVGRVIARVCLASKERLVFWDGQVMMITEVMIFGNRWES